MFGITMKRPQGNDITDKYFREAAQYDLLSGEQTTVLMKAIEEKGNKILWKVFNYNPAFIVNYFSKQEPKTNQSEEETAQFVEELFAPQSKKHQAEESFYAGLERLREKVSFVGVYRYVSEQYVKKLNEQEEQTLYGSTAKGKIAYQRHKRTLENLQEQRETLDELVSAWKEPRDTMAKHNLRLVISIARRFAVITNIKLPDCIQEGNEGLYRAIDGFDYRRGYYFSTYAGPWIKQNIQRYVANNRRAIRVPVHVQETMHKISRMEKILRNKLQKETFSPEEIAAQLLQEEAEKKINGKRRNNLPKAPTAKKIAEKALDIQKLQTNFYEVDLTSSLEAVLGEENNFTSKDLLTDTNSPNPEEKAYHTALTERMEEALSALDPREQDIIRARFGLSNSAAEPTLTEIGLKHSLCRERIRQIEADALKKLKKNKFLQELMNF